MTTNPGVDNMALRIYHIICMYFKPTISPGSLICVKYIDRNENWIF